MQCMPRGWRRAGPRRPAARHAPWTAGGAPISRGNPRPSDPVTLLAHDLRLLQRPSARPRDLWYDRSTARGSALPRQQPRTTRIIAERLFYATSGYQRMRPVMSDHKEGCGQGARLPATRQRAQGYCNQLGQSGQPGGPQRATRAACMRACTGICLHACMRCAAARGGLPGMHWDFSYPAGWLAEVLPDIVYCIKRLASHGAASTTHGVGAMSVSMSSPHSCNHPFNTSATQTCLQIPLLATHRGIQSQH
eukprot:COSAG01_NODE_7934_length_2985_cov_8.088011_2_plen_250_part_00